MKIIIDSTCQIEPQLIKELNLGFIDYPLFLNGKEYEHQWDSPTILEDKQKFIDLLKDKKNKAGTSGITKNTFIKKFNEYPGEEILLITQSISNSRSTGSALEKALKDHPEFDVKAFDTEILASGVGAQGLALMRELKVRDLNRDECYEILEKNKSNAWVVGLLYDLFYVHRSGRLGLAKAAVATALHLYPMLSSTPQSGVLKSTGKVRNYKQANVRFLGNIKNQMEEQNSKKLTVNLSYSTGHKVECLHMKELLLSAAEDNGWDVEIYINFSNFSLLPHMGPDFYEMGYVIHT